MIKSFRKDAVFDRCPECKSIGALRRSRARNSWEYLVKNSGFSNMYRCRECGWRGMKSNFSLKRISPKVILMYLLFIMFVAVFVRFVILKFIMR